MGCPPDKVTLPVIKGVGVMSLEEIRDALKGDVYDRDVLISSLCAHLNEFQDAAYEAWESAMGEDL